MSWGGITQRPLYSTKAIVFGVVGKGQVLAHARYSESIDSRIWGIAKRFGYVIYHWWVAEGYVGGEDWWWDGVVDDTRIWELRFIYVYCRWGRGCVVDMNKGVAKTGSVNYLRDWNWEMYGVCQCLRSDSSDGLVISRPKYVERLLRGCILVSLQRILQSRWSCNEEGSGVCLAHLSQ
jgi:hypothetical protein